MESASIGVNEGAAKEKVAWNDPKRYLWMIGLVVPLLPFVAVGLGQLTELSIVYWVGPFVVYLVIPVLDQMIGKDSSNPPESAISYLEQDRYYRWVTYAFIPIQFAGLIFACYAWANSDLSFFANLGLAVTVAMVGGIAINTAHELGHKRQDLEKWLSKVALAQTAYSHFFIEHNRGHHVRVATPEDPASAKLGESFYEFLPRTVRGSLVSAIHLERERLDRLGKSFWHPTNDLLNAWAMAVVLFAGLAIVFGPVVLPWLLLQAVIGFSLLEAVNYLEHYGLQRQWDPEKDRYELCRPGHSWNSDNIASNVFLYHLQRHSDHHANPLRRYQALRHFDGIPELPSGYATMIMMAYAWPVWKQKIDPMVASHYEGDLRWANVLPRKREEYFERYPVPEGAGEGPPGRNGSRGAEGDDPKEAQEAAAQGTEVEASAWRCPNCDYVYEVEKGAPREGFEAGTEWSEIPQHWNCPDCGVREKQDFEPLEAEPAAAG